MATYATGTDLLQRYDARLVGDLVRDDSQQESSGSLPTHPNLVAILADAGSEIEAALFVGGRYTPAQLTTLSDSAAQFLRRLNCDLALLMLKKRRGRFNAEKDGEFQKEVTAKLDSLRNGDNILMQATDTEAEASTIALDAPQIIPILRRQTIRNRTRNYYPDGPYGARSSAWPG